VKRARRVTKENGRALSLNTSGRIKLEAPERRTLIQRKNTIVEFDQFHLLIVPFGRSDLHAFAFQVGEVTDIFSACPPPLDHHDVLAWLERRKSTNRAAAWGWGAPEEMEMVVGVFTGTNGSEKIKSAGARAFFICMISSGNASITMGNAPATASCASSVGPRRRLSCCLANLPANSSALLRP